MMIVWRTTGNIIRTVLCSAVLYIRQYSDTYTHEQFLKMSVGFGLVFLRLFKFSILCVFLV